MIKKKEQITVEYKNGNDGKPHVILSGIDNPNPKICRHRFQLTCFAKKDRFCDIPPSEDCKCKLFSPRIQ